MRRLLTLHVRHRVELVPPLLTDMDGSASTHTVVRHTPVVVGRLDEGLGVLRVERVHHVVEVLPVRPAALGQFVGKVGHEASVILELWVKDVDAELVVLGHVDVPLLLKSEQPLLIDEDLPEEVLVYHGVRWDVELNYQKL